MIQAKAIGNRGEFVYVLGFTRADIDELLKNCTLITSIRGSKSGVEARIVIFQDADDDAIKDKLATFGERLAVTYSGPMTECGQVIRTP